MNSTRQAGRLPWPTRDELGADARRVYDRIVDGPRTSLTGTSAVVDADGRLLGPFNAMLASPAVGDALQQLGAAIRYGTSLPARVRELAILTVAAHYGSRFEWYAHHEPARSAGLGDATLDAVRAGEPTALSPHDQLVHRAVTGLLADRDLDEQTFGDVRALLGTTGVVELVSLVGYYDLLALAMRTFRTPLPDDAALGGVAPHGVPAPRLP